MRDKPNPSQDNSSSSTSCHSLGYGRHSLKSSASSQDGSENSGHLGVGLESKPTFLQELQELYRKRSANSLSPGETDKASQAGESGEVSSCVRESTIGTNVEKHGAKCSIERQDIGLVNQSQPGLFFFKDNSHLEKGNSLNKPSLDPQASLAGEMFLNTQGVKKSREDAATDGIKNIVTMVGKNKETSSNAPEYATIQRKKYARSVRSLALSSGQCGGSVSVSSWRLKPVPGPVLPLVMLSCPGGQVNTEDRVTHF